jgi:hypothetical protein
LMRAIVRSHFLSIKGTREFRRDERT